MLEHHRPNYFAILFTPRTGSHLLRSALAEHPDIASISTEGDTNPYVMHNWDLYPPTDRLTGHKMSAVHLHVRDRFGMIACPVIVTYRHNKLSQHISAILGTRDGYWSLSRQDYYDTVVRKQEQEVTHKQYKDKKFRLNVDGALRNIGVWQRVEARMRLFFPGALWIEYGDLVGGDGFGQAQEFLGLPVMELPKLLKKQSKGANLEYISNLNEVLNSPLAGWV